MAESVPHAGSDAATEDRLREHCTGSAQVYKGRLLDVRRDTVRLPDGSESSREYIVHPGAVGAVPILDDGRIVMVRQFRYPLGRTLLEIPAGKVDAGESMLTCAARELREETGYTAREWARAGVLHNAVAYSNEGIEIWFARGLTAGSAQLDAGEFVEVSAASLEDLEAEAAAGTLTDAKTLIALLWLRHWRDGRWVLQWQAHG